MQINFVLPSIFLPQGSSLSGVIIRLNGCVWYVLSMIDAIRRYLAALIFQSMNNEFENKVVISCYVQRFIFKYKIPQYTAILLSQTCIDSSRLRLTISAADVKIGAFKVVPHKVTSRGIVLRGSALVTSGRAVQTCDEKNTSWIDGKQKESELCCQSHVVTLTRFFTCRCTCLLYFGIRFGE